MFVETYKQNRSCFLFNLRAPLFSRIILSDRASISFQVSPSGNHRLIVVATLFFPLSANHGVPIAYATNISRFTPRLSVYLAFRVAQSTLNKDLLCSDSRY